MTGQYTFGDGDVAAERLALVAETFDPATRALLAAAVPPGVGLALDLGCGPGHTTRLVASVCRPRRTVGLERSEHFATLARQRYRRTATDIANRTASDTDTDTDTHADSGVRSGLGTGVEFAVHDVTEVPLPGAPADLIFARLLLAHLPDPRGLVERWRTQLAPGGVLVLDEIEAMTTPPGVLRRYEELVVALVAAEGGTMCAGPLLADLGGRLPEVDVPAPRAALMYGMNLATWRHEALARGLATDPELDALADDLAELADRTDPEAGATAVHWVLRQLVIPSAA
jgi:trans-aconitate 2-methyltransferase